MSIPSRLPVQVLTYDDPLFSHSLQTKLACEGGAKWIQFRCKNQSSDSYIEEAKKSQSICKQYQATWIVNDNVDLAFHLQADGVHLGMNDTPIYQIKKECPKNFIVGGTAHNLQEIEKQWEQGASYIGLGPFSSTTTKKKLSSFLGIKGIQKFTKAFSHIPFVGIGGIQLKDLTILAHSGLNTIALCSTIHKHKQTKIKTQIHLQAWENSCQF